MTKKLLLDALLVPQVFPRQNEKDPSRVEVDVMVREKPIQTADIEMEWQVAPGEDSLAQEFFNIVYSYAVS